MRSMILALTLAVGLATSSLAQEPVLVQDINDARSTNPAEYVTIGDVTYFTADDVSFGRELWKLTVGSTRALLVRDIWPGGGSSAPSGLTAQNGVLYFSANNGIHGAELWRSDGTAAGTAMVRDIAPGPGGSTPAALVDVYASLFYWRWKGSLFFTADDGKTGRELWTSDGTTGGTRLVKDIEPGAQTPNFEGLVNLDGVLYAGSPRGLWKSDGTPEGTIEVKSDSPAPGSDGRIYAQQLTVANGALFFVASDRIRGSELWTSNGKPSGTKPVIDLAPGASSSGPLYLTPAGKRLLFIARVDARGGALFVTDGSAAGTRRVTPPELSPKHQRVAVVGDQVYFAGDDGTLGTELWRTDTAGSTPTLVRDIARGPRSSSPVGLTAAGSVVYFSAGTNAEGTELWKSDGSRDGTTLVADLIPGAASCYPDALSVAGHLLVFVCRVPMEATSASVRDRFQGPLRSDGTTSGTFALSGISGRTGDSHPGRKVAGSTGLYFRANTPEKRAVWWTDGTVGKARLLTTFASHEALDTTFGRIGEAVYFCVTVGSGGDLNWYKSLGTAEGTGVTLGKTFREVRNISTYGNKMLFWGYTRETGTELWASDGTAAGTILLKDQTPGPESTKRSPLITVPSGVYFAVAVRDKGTVVWRTDGTPAGTRRISEAGNGTEGFIDEQVAAVGDAVVHVVDQWPGPREVRRTTGRSSTKIRGPEGGWRSPQHLTSHRGAVYLDDQGKLWRIDAVSDSASLVGHFESGAQVMAVVSADHRLFMMVNSHGPALWASEGTEMTTRLVKRLKFDHVFVRGDFVSAGDNVFFPASDAAGTELWTSDGTPDGTRRVSDIAIGPASSEPVNLSRFGNTLFFSADDGLRGRELWKLDLGTGSHSAPASAGPGSGQASDAGLDPF